MKIITHLVVSLAVGIILGAGVAVLSPGSFVVGWLASSILLVPCLFCLLFVWNRAGMRRSLGWMIAITFVLRLGLGMALSLALPQYGYNNPYQTLGYPVKDSYNRDEAAWNLATANKPLLAASSRDLYSDQYGGLLLLSAVIYRYLSPDAHRSFLILILTAFAFALGVPFLFQAVYHRWGKKLAGLTTWIFILYPDGIFFSSSQMREPFLIGAGAIAFWAVLSFQRSRRTSIGAFVGSILVMVLMSWRVTLPVLILLLGWFSLENMGWLKLSEGKWRKWILPVVGVLLILVLAFFSWEWFISATKWGIKTTTVGSGFLDMEINRIGSRWRIPFMVIYGLTQVVLPAAIAEPGIPLWKGIAIVRAIGWYALVPFLLYSFYLVWKVKPTAERRIMLWLIGCVFAWMLISSARAGGDMWDNPRYRTYFLPWMALLAAWTWQCIRQQRDAWFGRLILIEIIFLGFFTHWYFGRYIVDLHRMFFWQEVTWITGLSGLVIFGGLVWDFWLSRLFRNLIPPVRIKSDDDTEEHSIK